MAKCSDCGKALIPVLPDMPEGGEQYADTLVLQVHGGYGMYLDIFSEEDAERVRFMLCEECADRLLAAAPFMARVFGHNEWKEG